MQFLFFLILFSNTLKAESDINSSEFLDKPHRELKKKSENLLHITWSAENELSIEKKEIDRAVYEDVEQSIIEFRLDITDLAEQKFSKESIADWHLNMINLNRLAFDKVQNSSFFNDSTGAKRVTALIVNDIVSNWIRDAIAVAGHEKAHSETAERFGAETSYGHDSKPGKDLSLGDLFLTLLAHPFSEKSAWASWRTDEPLAPEQIAAISAGGLNYQMDLAADIVDQNIKNNQFHVVDVTPILNNKASIWFYYHSADKKNSDLENYVRRLAEQGHIKSDSQDSVLKRLSNLSILTVLLSGSSINSFKALSRYIKKGDTSIEVTGFNTRAGKVTLPEFETFLNTTNVSVRVSSYLIQDDGAILQAGYEQPVIGDRSGLEINLGAHKQLKKRLYAEGGVRYNTESDSYGGVVELGYNLNKSWRLIGGLDYESGKNGGTWAGGRKHGYVFDGQDETFGYLHFQLQF